MPGRHNQTIAANVQEKPICLSGLRELLTLSSAGGGKGCQRDVRGATGMRKGAIFETSRVLALLLQSGTQRSADPRRTPEILRKLHMEHSFQQRGRLGADFQD